MCLVDIGLEVTNLREQINRCFGVICFNDDLSREEIFRIHPVSLWNMLRFYAQPFLDSLRALDFLGNLQRVGNQDIPLEPMLRENIMGHLETLRESLKTLNLRMSLINAELLRVQLEESKVVDDFITRSIAELGRRVRDEIELELLFRIPSDRAKFYNPDKPIFGSEVSDKFPNLTYDTVEAGNCYAVARYSACVFHLMRIMEYVVQQIGLAITGITGIVDENWKNIIDRTRKEIVSRFPKEKDPDRIKWESLLGHLETVKIAWRNPTMHPKETYTEEEAENIIRAVKTLLREIVMII